MDDTDDNRDYVEMMEAMATMDMSAEEQSEVLQVVSGILHLGNVMFREEGNERAVVETDQCKCGSCARYFSELSNGGKNW